MKLIALIAALAAMVVAPTAAKAGDKPLTTNISAAATLSDKYIAPSGFIPYDGPSVQPSVTATANHQFGSVLVNYWGNFSIDGTGNEQDLTAAYTTPSLDLGTVGQAAASAGYFGGRSYGVGLGEANLTLSLANILNPSMTVARDFSDGSGVYGGVSVNPTIRLDDTASVSVTEALRFNDGYFVDSSGITGLRSDVALNLRAGENITLSIGGRHHLALDSNFRSGFAFTNTLTYSHDLL